MNLTRGLIAAVFAMFCASVKAQNKLKQGNTAAAPEDWLLARQGPKWWYDMVAQRLGGR